MTRAFALPLGALLLAVACRAAAPAAGAAEPAAGGGNTATGDGAAPLTVREVLERPSLVGLTVQVRGRCLGYGTIRASGGPPRTRSDWQLTDGEVAIWVTGPRPTDCSATEGSTHDDTITARVEQDTVRVVEARERRYLVVGRV